MTMAEVTTLVRTDELWTRDQIELMKRTVARNCTDDELKLFLHTCTRYGLDPLVSQIYAIKRKRWNGQLKAYEEVMGIQVGIDGYRSMAERTGQYCPGKSGRFEVHELGGKRDLSCTVTVLKRVPGATEGTSEWREVEATAWFGEYAVRTKDGELNDIWGRRPKGQLEKCAETLALRKAFPSAFGNIRTDEEMEHVPAVQGGPEEQKVVSEEEAKRKLTAERMRLDKQEKAPEAQRKPKTEQKAEPEPYRTLPSQRGRLQAILKSKRLKPEDVTKLVMALGAVTDGDQYDALLANAEKAAGLDIHAVAAPQKEEPRELTQEPVEEGRDGLPF